LTLARMAAAFVFCVELTLTTSVTMLALTADTCADTPPTAPRIALAFPRMPASIWSSTNCSLQERLTQDVVVVTQSHTCTRI